MLAVYQFLGNSSSMQRLSYAAPVYDQREEFDPSLSHLNTISKLEFYCDSLSQENHGGKAGVSDKTFAETAAGVVRKRFYHGYSLYGFSNNFMAMMSAQLLGGGLSAIVIPNDILKYPYAACSQQSIVMMQLLKRKGIKTRKVGFTGNATGHFCFEAFYNNSWHYFDTDKEPDASLLTSLDRPSIDWLNQHKEVLVAAYPQYSKDYVMDVFTKYSYGKVGKFPAPRALIFQQGAKILSYTIWIFFLIAFVVCRRYYLSVKKKNTTPVVKLEQNALSIPLGLSVSC